MFCRWFTITVAHLTFSTSDGAMGRRLPLLSGYVASSSRSVFCLPGALRPTFRGERESIDKLYLSPEDLSQKRSFVVLKKSVRNVDHQHATRLEIDPVRHTYTAKQRTRLFHLQTAYGCSCVSGQGKPCLCPRRALQLYWSIDLSRHLV